MYYAFTPNSVFKLVPPLCSEPTWQTSMLHSDIVPLIYVNETICMVICLPSRFMLIILRPRMNHLVPRLSPNASYGWGAWCHFEFKTFLSFIKDCWWPYNIQLKTSRGVLFLPPSDAYLRSFLHLLYTLIKLYYTKLWAIKPRLWHWIEFFSSRGQESWCLLVKQSFTMIIILLLLLCLRYYILSAMSSHLVVQTTIITQNNSSQFNSSLYPLPTQ